LCAGAAIDVYNRAVTGQLPAGAATIDGLLSVVEVLPAFCNARLTLGRALHAAARRDEAARTYNDCLEACGGDPSAAQRIAAGGCANNLALLLEQSAGQSPGAWSRIEQLYLAAMNLDPSFAGSRSNYGRCVRAGAAWRGRVAWVFTCRCRRTRRWVGSALAAQGKHAEAVSVFIKVLEQNPHDASTIIELGNFYFRIANYAAAAEWYSKAVDAALPGSVDARNSLSNLARAQWLHGDLSSSITTLNRWRALYGDDMTAMEPLMMTKRSLLDWAALEDIDAWIRASPALVDVCPYHLQMMEISMMQLRQVCVFLCLFLRLCLCLCVRAHFPPCCGVCRCSTTSIPAMWRAGVSEPVAIV
jgi:tetratricopeptide (TPR) repeat protein